MCESCDSELLEEYRRMIKGLFSMFFDKISSLENQLYRYRLQEEKAAQERSMQEMINTVRKGK